MDVRQVPVVNIRALTAFPTDAEVDAALRDAKDDAIRQIIEEIRAAASEWGFFYIADHGLPQQEIDEFQESMRSFFRLPVETKRTILRTANNNRGYVVDELTKNKTDWKQCFDFAGAHEDEPPTDKTTRLGNDQDQWLDEETLPGFRHEMQTYYKKVERIARRLLKVFAVSLGESQTWVNVPPRKGTYTINIGDVVQVWSNDKFMAPLHRVVASDKADRYSAPFFYNPSNHVTVEPIVVKEGEVANYRPFNWHQFQLARYQGNYADVGKETQIGDFKINGPIDVANA